MNPREKSFLARVKHEISAERYRHVVGVMNFAGELAQAHQLDASRARIAGLLHDVARCWSDRRLIQYAKRRQLDCPGLEFMCRHQPVLLHAYVGADLARERYGVRDRQILSAIRKHTLGAARMAPLEKCLFLADMLSPDRIFPQAQELRALARRDLDEALCEGIKAKIGYLLKQRTPIHPEMIKIWNAWVSR